MKKFVGLALLGLVAFNSCDSELNVSEKRETVAAARAYIDDEIDFTWEGWTGTFVFKNGKKVSGYIDGYANKNGTIAMEVYFTSHLKDWRKRLDDAGIEYRYEATSNPFLYQYIRFSTSLVRSKK